MPRSNSNGSNSSSSSSGTDERRTDRKTTSALVPRRISASELELMTRPCIIVPPGSSVVPCWALRQRLRGDSAKTHVRSMNRTDVDDARERRRARALNASPLNYSAVHTHGNRRTVKSMNPAMEFAPRRREALESTTRVGPRFFRPGFSLLSAVANHPGGELVLRGSARLR